MADNGLFFRLGLDNSRLQADARRAINEIRSIGDSAEAEGARIDNAYKRIAGAVGGYFTWAAAKTFISHIVQVRGEIESLSISFETLLGNKQKADALFSEIKDFAVKTPMELAPLAKGAQTLLSFNVEAEKVMPVLRQIGDISMGSSDKFNSLVLAFSQMHSTGKLMGQDLLQMINAGFNPLAVIAEKTGKSISQLKVEMSAGAISAEMVAGAFASAAGAGGKFYGMLEKQSKGIQGSLANLQGAIDDMFNELGTEGQSAITAVVSGATEIVKHYKAVGEALAVCISLYGTYKAAAMASVAVTRISTKVESMAAAAATKAEIAALTKLLPIKQAVANEDLIAAVAVGRLTQAKADELIAIRAEVQAKLSDLKVTAQQAVAELAAAKATHMANLQRVISAKALVAQREKEMAVAHAAGNIRQREIIRGELLQAQEERSLAVKAKKASADQLAIARSKVSVANKAAETLAENINSASQIGNTASTNMLTAAKTRLVAVMGKLKAVMLAHPYALVAAAIAAVGYAIYKLVTYQTQAEKVTKDLNKELGAEEALLNVLVQRFKRTEKGTREYSEAKKQLEERYGETLKSINLEVSALHDSESAYRSLTEEVKNNTKEKIRNKYIEQYTSESGEEVYEQYSGMRVTIFKKLGEEAGSEFYTQVKDYVEKAMRYVDDEGNEQFRMLTSEQNRELASMAESVGVSWRSIVPYINKIGSSNHILQRNLKELDGTLDGYTQTVKESTDAGKESEKEYDNITKKVAAVRENIITLNKEIADLRSGKTVTGKGELEKLIESKLDELATQEKLLKTLTGKGEKKEGDTENKANKQKVETAERLAAIKESQDKIRQQEADGELEIMQLMIDLMDEGLAKQIAQIDLNYEKRKNEVAKKSAEFIRQYQEIERKEWEAANPDYKEKGKVFTPTTVSVEQLPQNVQTQLESMMAAVVLEWRQGHADLIKDGEAAMNDYLKEYGTFEERRLAVTKEYNDKISKATSEGEKLKLGKELDKELKDLEKRMGKSKKVWTVLMGDLGGLTSEMLKDYIARAEELVKSSEDSASDETKNMVDTIEKARRFLAKKNPFREMYDALVKYKKAVKDGDAEGVNKYFSRFNEAAEEVKSTVDSITSSLGNVGGLVSEDLKRVIESIGGIVGGVVEAIRVFGNESASSGDKIKGISGIISAVTSIAGDMMNAFEEEANTMREFDLSIERFANEYFLSMQKIRDVDYDTIFGEKSIGKAIDAYDNLMVVQDRYHRSLWHLGASSRENSFATDMWGKDEAKQMEMRRKALRETNDEIKSMTLLVSEPNFWQKLFGKSSTFTTLKDLAPELWDDSGEFNVEAAKVFLETNSTINKENNKAQKETLENLIKLKEADEELLAIIDSQLSSIFGHLSGDLTDAIFDSIRNGSNAWDLFEDAGLKVIDALGKQLVKEMYIQAYLDTFRDRMRAAYETGDIEQTQKELAQIMTDIYSGMPTVLDGARKAAEDWDKMASDQGWDMSKLADQKEESRQATQKGFASMTQDSADELNGRFAIMTEHTRAIKILTENSARILAHLAGIESNTRYCENLADMNSNIASIKSGIDDMNLKGVLLKKAM